MNDYDLIAERYQGAHDKPDVRYSVVPTVLSLVGDLEGRRVLDVGCGDGFFTELFAARGAAEVYGLDSSARQIELARQKSRNSNVKYIQQDMFRWSDWGEFPLVDVVVAPFVLNYAQIWWQLHGLFEAFRWVLRECDEEGRLVAVIDMPSGQDLSRFGARKSLPRGAEDGASMQIELFNEGQPLLTLSAIYFQKETVEINCRTAKFKEVSWANPIISQEGLEKMGSGFWEGYLENPELAYLVAEL
ncbi:MAG: class I SAM-dependent methyltransferase [bacterium]